MQAVGYEVADVGDCAPQLYQPDDEHPRARNLPAILAALNELKPRVEHAVKSGALPLILGGDCIIALATIAGVRRYYHKVSLVWMDRDADLNVPATTPSGCVDGMAVSHIIGRGAPELVRFWTEPPLVREPDVALFGVDRLVVDLLVSSLAGRLTAFASAESTSVAPAPVEVPLASKVASPAAAIAPAASESQAPDPLAAAAATTPSTEGRDSPPGPAGETSESVSSESQAEPEPSGS